VQDDAPQLVLHLCDGDLDRNQDGLDCWASLDRIQPTLADQAMGAGPQAQRGSAGVQPVSDKAIDGRDLERQVVVDWPADARPFYGNGPPGNLSG
jgi:hypothetical protein